MSFLLKVFTWWNGQTLGTRFFSPFGGKGMSKDSSPGVFASTSLTIEGGVPLVKQVTIDFLKPATTDVTARASLTEETIERVLAETAAHGKSNFDLATEVVDADGVVVARTSGAYQLRVFSSAVS